MANTAYDLAVDLMEAFERRDLERARKLQHALVPVNKALTIDFGIAGLKFLLDQIGFYGGPYANTPSPPGSRRPAETHRNPFDGREGGSEPYMRAWGATLLVASTSHSSQLSE